MRGARTIVVAVVQVGLVSVLQGAPPEHPHLLFTKTDLPAFRDRVKAGLARETWEALKTRCDRAVADETAVLELVAELARPDAPHHKKAELRQLAIELPFAWHLLQEAAYRDRFLAMMAAIEKHFPKPGDAPVHWPYTYDLGYDLMSPAQRDRVREHLLRQCAERFEKLRHEPLALSDSSLGLRVSNCHCASAAGIGLPAAAAFGEPGYRQEWLDAAARIMRELLDEAVGPDGMFLEHPTYWSYGMDGLGGLEMLWVLRGKGTDLTAHAGLLATPQWLCHATTPLGVTDARGDACHTSPHTGVTVLVHHLRPQDPAANWLLERTGRTVPGDVGPILTILWDTPLGDTTLQGRLPRVRHYPDTNIVYYHSDWSPDAVYSAFQARWEWGHCHNDIGHFTLWAHRHIWAIDSGYGIGEAEAHNTVLIDGQGMGSDKDGPSRSAGGELRQVLDSPLATMAAADLREAYSYRISGHFDWVLHWPGEPVARADRYWHVIHGTAHVPTYLLMVDRLQKDRGEHVYTWLMGTPLDNELRLAADRATLHNPHNASFVRGHDNPDLTLDETKRFYIETDVTLAHEGQYELWAFARTQEYTGAYINQWVDGRSWGYMPIGGPVWQWVKVSRQRLKLEPGKHVVRINQNPSAHAVWLKRILLTRDPNFQPPATGIVNTDDTVTVALDPKNTRVLKPWTWASLPYPHATLEVAFLQPKPVALSEDLFTARGRWHHERHRRLRATARGVRGDFAVLLYPRRAEQPPLAIGQSDAPGFDVCLTWPAAADHMATGATTVDHLDPDGRIVKPGHGGDAELALVRETKGGVPAGYLLTSGTRLGFRDRTLVEARDIGPCGLVSVASDGQTLAVVGHIRPDAKWPVERTGTLLAYGPGITTAVVNGQPVAVHRDGDYVRVPIRTRRFVGTTERITQRIQQRYDRGQAVGTR